MNHYIEAFNRSLNRDMIYLKRAIIDADMTLKYHLYRLIIAINLTLKKYF